MQWTLQAIHYLPDHLCSTLAQCLASKAASIGQSWTLYTHLTICPPKLSPFTCQVHGSPLQIRSMSSHMNVSRPHYLSPPSGWLFLSLPGQQNSWKCCLISMPSLPFCHPSFRLQMPLFRGTTLDKFTTGLHTAEYSDQFSALILTSQQPETQLFLPSFLRPLDLWTPHSPGFPPAPLSTAESPWWLLFFTRLNVSGPFCALSPWTFSLPSMIPISRSSPCSCLEVCLQDKHFQTVSLALTSPQAQFCLCRWVLDILPDSWLGTSITACLKLNLTSPHLPMLQSAQSHRAFQCGHTGNILVIQCLWCCLSWLMAQVPWKFHCGCSAFLMVVSILENVHKSLNFTSSSLSLLFIDLNVSCDGKLLSTTTASHFDGLRWQHSRWPLSLCPYSSHRLISQRDCWVCDCTS